jgi:hypothetical protein
MALTKVSRGLLTTSIVDNGNDTAITIDSSENVTFSGTATAVGLTVNTSSVGGFKVTNEATSGVRLTAYQGTTNSNVRAAYVDAQEFVVSTGAPTGTTVTEAMSIGSTGIIYVNGDGTGGRISGDGSGGLNLQDGNGRQTFKIMSPSSGSSQAMTLDASGSLLVGGTAAGTVSGNNAMITVRRDSGNCGISYQSGTAATDQWETYSTLGAQFYIENTSTSNGAYLQYNSGSGWTNVSDERWKTNWTSLEDASSKIAALSVGKYHMLNNSKETIESAKWDYGVKAQELLEVIPDAVDVPENPEDKYGVVPNIVFWHAVKAIQEQQTLITALTARVAELEG